MFKFRSYLHKEKEKSNNKNRIGFYIGFGLILLLALVITSLVRWSDEFFGVGIENIILTTVLPMKGANSGVVVKSALKACLPVIFLPLLAYVLLAFTCVKFIKKIKFKRILKIICALVCSLSLIASLIYAERVYSIIDYAKTKNQTTTIYEDYYVNPTTVNITKNGNTKNLICIYLESMETSYSSINEGGFQQVNLIPNLTQLANENQTFSNSQKLGGFYTITGTSWTMSALFALNSGIPYSYPVKDIVKNKNGPLADNLTTLGDVLKQKGYVQEFLCGSDADFGDRRRFFSNHGYDKIFDYYSAIENGYIDEDYHEFWGLEDQKLYKIAKDELTKLASNGAPFNFSMLTVDTHFPGGYECALCKNEYENKAANVVSCADKQIKDFIDWCKGQDFYEDTVIVLLGDHPRMERVLVPSSFEKTDRTNYNCIINATKTTEDVNYYNRTFTAMDCFPTVLSAMGFNIEGDRLGLGTNLFSKEKTLPEKIGFEYFKKELSKHSEFYIKNFS